VRTHFVDKARFIEFKDSCGHKEDRVLIPHLSFNALNISVVEYNELTLKCKFVVIITAT
jgi:hypothetical protein